MKISSTIWILLAMAAALFIISLVLVIISGVDLRLAAIWNILSSLDINFDLLPVTVANTPLILLASLIDAFVFAILAVAIATVFFDAIKQIDIKKRLIISKIKKLQDHVIIVPYNSFAETMYKQLEDAGKKAVIIVEKESEARLLYRRNALVLIGDPRSEEIYRIANIRRAKYVIACGDDDIQNALIVVTAKTANSKIKIVSRVRYMDNIQKLGVAGAYRMIMAEVTAGTDLGGELVRRALA